MFSLLLENSAHSPGSALHRRKAAVPVAPQQPFGLHNAAAWTWPPCFTCEMRWEQEEHPAVLGVLLSFITSTQTLFLTVLVLCVARKDCLVSMHIKNMKRWDNVLLKWGHELLLVHPVTGMSPANARKLSSCHAATLQTATSPYGKEQYRFIQACPY